MEIRTAAAPRVQEAPPLLESAAQNLHAQPVDGAVAMKVPLCREAVVLLASVQAAGCPCLYRRLCCPRAWQVVSSLEAGRRLMRGWTMPRLGPGQAASVDSRCLHLPRNLIL